MRELLLLTLALSIMSVPLYCQEMHLPKDGNGLVDYCDHVVKIQDSPASQDNPDKFVVADNMMKFGWCAGYIEATRQIIDGWRLNGALDILKAKREGNKLVDHTLADQDFVEICMPQEVSLGQIARVLVKWLRDHPEKLHEPEYFSTMSALKTAFPCAK